MTKILVEILGKNTEGFFTVEKSKTVNIGAVSQQNKQKAIDRLNQLKSTLTVDEKIRVIEYHNDDPDKTRTACKILFEG